MIPAAVEMRAAVLDWYRANGRPLAFRATADPWAILVSEFMAQQTQAARAAEAWQRFLVRYPTPAALAAASPADALRSWRGLGYNRRALSLRAAAIAIVDGQAGQVPSEVEVLDSLPGVGPYTARAVAALAFGARVGAVDTNVRRVVGRAILGAVPTTPAGEREVQRLADELVPADRPGEWTHALMDIGATFCRPRNPRCEGCPVRPVCLFAARGGTTLGANPAPALRPSAGRRNDPASAFRSTSRWLRGRILDRLRDAPADTWVELNDPIGPHPVPAVAAALQALAKERLLEVRPGTGTEARLPTA